jgi:ferredoxin-NADP reductase
MTIAQPTDHDIATNRVGPTVAADGLGSRAAPATLRVIETRRLSERLLHLKLARDDGAAFAFRAGQFCRVAVPADDAIGWRSYTIATPPSGDGVSDVCEIAVAAMPGGLASAYLFGLRPGDRLQASGPFGAFTLPVADPERYILIGTGTGMAPYRAMQAELARRAAADALDITLLIGVRRPQEALYVPDFVDFVRGGMNRRLAVSYSRMMPNTPSGHETSGHVQQQLQKLTLSPDHDHIMLCGNPQMVEECTTMVQARGVAPEAITSEKYVAGPAPRRLRRRRRRERGGHPQTL